MTSSGSSGRGGGGGKKHEIYATAFGGHLFYDLFLQGRGGHVPLPPPPGSAAGDPVAEWLLRPTLMAWSHCRIRTWIRTPNSMATLHYAEVFTLHRVRFRFQP